MVLACEESESTRESSLKRFAFRSAGVPPALLTFSIARKTDGTILALRSLTAAGCTYEVERISSAAVFSAEALEIRMPSNPFERIALHRAGSTSAGNSWMQKRFTEGCAESA